jgi:hypothetical protein
MRLSHKRLEATLARTAVPKRLFVVQGGIGAGPTPLEIYRAQQTLAMSDATLAVVGCLRDLETEAQEQASAQYGSSIEIKTRQPL